MAVARDMTKRKQAEAQQPPALLKVVADIELNWLGVPLQSHVAAISTLILHNGINEATHSIAEIELLELVSTQVTLAIERKQILERLQYMALYTA